jgi:hypothetical protein
MNSVCFVLVLYISCLVFISSYVLIVGVEVIVALNHTR